MRYKKRDIDQGYMNFRNRVLKRDKRKCKMPGCKKGGYGMEVHHIRPYAKHPSIRTDVDNGITLCKVCHKSIRLYEELYASLFDEIIKVQRESKKK